MLRTTDLAYLSDDGRSGYHTCGPTPRARSSYRSVFCTTRPSLDAAVNFKARQRHTINDGNVAVEKEARMLHIALTASPAFFDMRIADALV